LTAGKKGSRLPRKTGDEHLPSLEGGKFGGKNPQLAGRKGANNVQEGRRRASEEGEKMSWSPSGRYRKKRSGQPFLFWGKEVFGSRKTGKRNHQEKAAGPCIRRKTEGCFFSSAVEKIKTQQNTEKRGEGRKYEREPGAPTQENGGMLLRGEGKGLGPQGGRDFALSIRLANRKRASKRKEKRGPVFYRENMAKRDF